MGISVRFVEREMDVGWWFGSVGSVYLISFYVKLTKGDDLPFGFSGRRVAGPPFDHFKAILLFSSPGISLAEVSKVPLNTSRMT